MHDPFELVHLVRTKSGSNECDFVQFEYFNMLLNARKACKSVSETFLQAC